MNQTMQRERLRKLIEGLCLLEGDFTLSTGAKSKFYFDCKRATLNGDCVAMIGQAFLEEINHLPERPEAIGGLTMGADFITTAVTMLAAMTNHSTKQGSIVRKEPKKHGTRTWIENELPQGTKIVVVDDVVTSGSSTATACKKFQEAGYRIVGIMALIDREAGGMENLASFGVPVRAIFRKRDFPSLNQMDRTNDAIKSAAANA